MTQAISQSTSRYYAIPPQTHGKVTYGLEELEYIYKEMEPLLAAHWGELEEPYMKEPMDPDWDKLMNASGQGNLLVFTARQDEELLGYVVFFLTSNTNVKTKLCAREMVFYVTPDRRGTSIAQQLVAMAYSVLKKLKVTYMLMTDKAPVGGRNLSTLFEHFGMEPVTTTYIVNMEKGGV